MRSRAAYLLLHIVDGANKSIVELIPFFLSLCMTQINEKEQINNKIIRTSMFFHITKSQAWSLPGQISGEELRAPSSHSSTGPPPPWYVWIVWYNVLLKKNR